MNTKALLRYVELVGGAALVAGVQYMIQHSQELTNALPMWAAPYVIALLTIAGNVWLHGKDSPLKRP